MLRGGVQETWNQSRQLSARTFADDRARATGSAVDRTRDAYGLLLREADLYLNFIAGLPGKLVDCNETLTSVCCILLGPSRNTAGYAYQRF